MNSSAVLLDTSFFLRFLNDKDPLYKNADAYFRYFLQQNITMMISTVSIAEYCVGGDIHELPLKNLQIVALNVDHAKRAGEFARVVFQNKNKLQISQRNLIPNDTKLFAQADIEKSIAYYLTSDTESQKIYEMLRREANPKFQFIDLRTPYSDTFGILDL